MTHAVGVVGLGVMGSRMAQALARHPGFKPTHGWDLDARRRDAFKQAHPDAEVAPPAEWVARVDAVYIATPPATHPELVRQAAAAGAGVFCEKPLAVDVDDARRAVAEAARVPNAINFPFAAAPAVAALEGLVRAAGAPRRVEVQFHFAQWPRAWQHEAAGWLAGREQGGFTREVFSHFAYLTRRLCGPCAVRWARVRHPDDAARAETHVLAELACGEVPVTVVGGVGGAAPDFNAWTLYGEAGSARLQDWGRVFSGDAEGWTEVEPSVKEPFPLAGQLDALDRTLAGAPALPDLPEGLHLRVLGEAQLQGT